MNGYKRTAARPQRDIPHAVPALCSFRRRSLRSIADNAERVTAHISAICFGPGIALTETRSVLAIVYISSFVREFSADELRALLQQSSAKNARLGVTGILLHKDMDLMQLLEGPAETVMSLAKTIYADPRHHGIIQMLERQISHREFPDWSMAFRDLGTSSRVQQLATLMENDSAIDRTEKQHPTAVLRLLVNFGLNK